MKNVGPIHFRLSGDIPVAQSYIPLARTLHGLTKIMNGRLPNEPLVAPPMEDNVVLTRELDPYHSLDPYSIVNSIFGDLAPYLEYNGERWNSNRLWNKTMFQIDGAPLFAGPDHQHTWRFVNNDQQTVTVSCLADLDIDRVRINVTSGGGGVEEKKEECKPYFWAGLRWTGGCGVGDDWNQTGAFLHLYEPWPDADEGLGAEIDYENKIDGHQVPVYFSESSHDLNKVFYDQGFCRLWFNGLGPKFYGGEDELNLCQSYPPGFPFSSSGWGESVFYNWDLAPIGWDNAEDLGGAGVHDCGFYDIYAPSEAAGGTYKYSFVVRRSRYGAYAAFPGLAHDPEDDTQNWAYSIHVDPDDPEKLETGLYPYPNPCCSENDDGSPGNPGYERKEGERYSLDRYFRPNPLPIDPWQCRARVLPGEYIVRVSSWTYDSCEPVSPIECHLKVKVGKGECRIEKDFYFTLSGMSPGFRPIWPGGYYNPIDLRQEDDYYCIGKGLYSAAWWDKYIKVNIAAGTIKESDEFDDIEYPLEWFGGTGLNEYMDNCYSCCEGEYSPKVPIVYFPGSSIEYFSNCFGLAIGFGYGMRATVDSIINSYDGTYICKIIIDNRCPSCQPYGNGMIAFGTGYTVCSCDDPDIREDLSGIGVDSEGNPVCYKLKKDWAVGDRVVILPVGIYPSPCESKFILTPEDQSEYIRWHLYRGFYMYPDEICPGKDEHEDRLIYYGFNTTEC